MNEQLTDQVLIERVQKGDKQAFNLLVIKYQNKVCNLISRYINNSGDVADVAQEAFIKAYRAIPNFRGESSFYTWLYRIAVNTAKTTRFSSLDNVKFSGFDISFNALPVS